MSDESLVWPCVHIEKPSKSQSVIAKIAGHNILQQELHEICENTVFH